MIFYAVSQLSGVSRRLINGVISMAQDGIPDDTGPHSPGPQQTGSLATLEWVTLADKAALKRTKPDSSRRTPGHRLQAQQTGLHQLYGFHNNQTERNGIKLGQGQHFIECHHSSPYHEDSAFRSCL